MKPDTLAKLLDGRKLYALKADIQFRAVDDERATALLSAHFLANLIGEQSPLDYIGYIGEITLGPAPADEALTTNEETIMKLTELALGAYSA